MCVDINLNITYSNLILKNHGLIMVTIVSLSYTLHGALTVIGENSSIFVR